ncbi:glycosyltransferase family 4 protein [Telmatospirillum sp.]|uniref:MraY family glycosyltransferase n=1 Tax=Telmatospirillum sp. TaxID=2079197 RepID=UPI002841994B|nr:glycosyltransferase family 4 protein [Telmatospirillum sp.]MDR3441062.1 glycosyltransferase family 4 protein [Telmatospirillum sp.]
MTTVLYAFFLPLLAAIGGTRLALIWLRHKQILDRPNDRSSHSQPTPRGGGLAVTPVILLAWIGLAVAGDGQPGLLVVLVGGAALFALSWLDDKGGLPARLRLAVHALAVAAGLIAMPADLLICQGWLPLWADRLVAFGAWVWFLNLFNFMDGIDGISGVETMAIAFGLALLDSVVGDDAGSAQAVVIGATALGFLVWNWHPAKIFLGDSGSVPLGYLLGWLLLQAAGQGLWAPALILPAYYLTDATLTLGKRAWRGEHLLQPHRQHFYQRAVRGGASHAAVSGIILGADVLLVALALLGRTDPLPGLAGAVLTVILLLAYLNRLGKGAPP